MQDSSWPIWSISRRARWFYFGALFVVLAVAAYISWRASSTFLELWGKVSSLTLSSVVVALYISEILGGGYTMLASLWDDWWQKRKQKQRELARVEAAQAGAQEVLSTIKPSEAADSADGDEEQQSAIMDDS